MCSQVRNVTLTSFCMWTLRAMNVPRSTAFIVSHRFGYVVPSFLLNSKKFLISFFLSLFLDLEVI